jgi:hypothetical protein
LKIGRKKEEIKDKMNRENYRKTKRKSIKFREFYDEDFGWEDKIEMLNRRKKLGKKSQRRNLMKANFD